MKTTLSLSSLYRLAKEASWGTLETLRAIRIDPDPFQKICIVAFSTLRIINDQCKTNYFPQLITILDGAPALDFYVFCRAPRHFFFPVKPESIDENKLLKSLKEIFCVQKQKISEEKLKEGLTKFLSEMSDKNIAFKSKKEMANFVLAWLKSVFIQYPAVEKAVNANNLKIEFKSRSWLDFGIVHAAIAADVLCVPDFLQSWNIIDLAPFAERMGGLPVLYLISNHLLGDYVWGALGVGFVFQVIKAVYLLSDKTLSADEIVAVRLLFVSSLAEAVYCSSNILRFSGECLNVLAFIAKGTGLIAFFFPINPRYFQPEAHAKIEGRALS